MCELETVCNISETSIHLFKCLIFWHKKLKSILLLHQTNRNNLQGSTMPSNVGTLCLYTVSHLWELQYRPRCSTIDGAIRWFLRVKPPFQLCSYIKKNTNGLCDVCITMSHKQSWHMVLMSPRKYYTHTYRSTILILCVKKVLVLIKALCHEGAQSACMTPCTVNLRTKQRWAVSFKPIRRAPKAHWKTGQVGPTATLEYRKSSAHWVSHPTWSCH